MYEICTDGLDPPEQDVGFLECTTEHHALLVVDVVVRCPVHHQVLLVGQLLGLRVDVASLVASQVVLRGGQAQVSEERWVIIMAMFTSSPCLTSHCRYCRSRSSW